MNISLRALLGATAALALTGAAMAETTITVATVNNGDMIRMQGLMDDFYAKHPDIKVEWVTLEENVLRQNVTTDIATKAAVSMTCSPSAPMRFRSGASRAGWCAERPARRI
jgi:sorbitol/mannitol transport system substrate-binding protein